MSELRSFHELLENDVNQLADTPQIVKEGLDYFYSGAVVRLKVGHYEIQATVEGKNKQKYFVELWIDDDNTLGGKCTCSHEGYGCHHMVAVFYAYIKKYHNNHTTKIDRPIDEKEELTRRFSLLNKDNLISILVNIIDKASDKKEIILQEVDRHIFEESKKQSSVSQACIKIENDIDKIFDRINENNITETSLLLEKYIPRIRELSLHETIYLSWLIIVHLEDAITEYNDDYNDLFSIQDELAKYLIDLVNDRYELNHAQKKEILEDCVNFIANPDQDNNYIFQEIALEMIKNVSDYDFLAKKLSNLLDNVDENYRIFMVDLLCYLHKQYSPEDFLLLRNEYLHYTNDYLDLAEFYWQQQDKEKAISSANKGLEEGEGIKDGLFEFLVSIGDESDDIELQIDTLTRWFKTTPHLKLYQDIKNVAGMNDLWDDTKPGLLDNLDAKRNGKILIEIALYEGNYDEAIEIIKSYSEPYATLPAELFDQLLIKHPEITIEYYKFQIEKNLKSNKLEKIEDAADAAYKLKKIFLEQLNQSDKWNEYLKKILQTHTHLYNTINRFQIFRIIG